MAIHLSGCRAKVERAHELRNTLKTIASPAEEGTPHIEDTCQGFAKRRGALQEIPSSYWTIFDAAQPYNGGNLLALLRDLSNHDKHRVLTPTLIRPESFEPIGEPVRARQLRGFDNTHAEKNLKVGAEIMRAKLVPSPYPETDVEVAGYIAPYVLLPQGDHAVVEGLGGIIREVEDIINDVAMHLEQLGLQT